MGFGGLVRKAVALADVLTAGTDGLQASVSHYAWLSQDETGKPTYRTAVARAAIVTYETRQARDSGGMVVQTRATVLFPRPVAVDLRDKIVLPDGTTGPLYMKPGNVVDASTGAPYLMEVMLG